MACCTALQLICSMMLSTDESVLRRYEQSQPHMGTTFRLIFYAADDASATRAAQAAFQRIAHLNSVCSDYVDDSELMRLNRRSGGPPVKVSKELFEVVRQSVEMSEASGGAFDISVGPVVRLWRRARRQRRMPRQEILDEYRKRVGFRHIRLDENNQTIELKQSSMRLDLGGIAKGYTCQSALEVLNRHGVTKALIDGGGDIVLGGPPPGKPAWTVAVGGSGATPTLKLKNCAVATSGDTSQFVVLDGKRYSHIVDPRTGIALTNRIQVTVIAPNGALADALASTLSVLGAPDGLKLLQGFPETAAHIHYVAVDKEQTTTSSGWRKLVAPRR